MSGLCDIASVRVEQCNTLYSTLEESLYCAVSDPKQCRKLCANADLVGIGVRIAFYFQAFGNALLVYNSPQDSAQGIWSATVLTTALVVPAMISKFHDDLTLYHAHMVLNFATLSTVTSLAVAPACPVWRDGLRDGDPNPNHPLARGRTRARIVLSLALLLQITLQWSWTIIVFAHPFYSQPVCSKTIKLVLGVLTVEAEGLNGKYFYQWALWLLFSLLVTLGWGIHMVVSSFDEFHDAPSYSIAIPFPQPGSQPPSGVSRPISKIASSFMKLFSTSWWIRAIIPPDDGHFHKRVIKRLSDVAALLVVLMYLVVSELQMTQNDIYEGENSLKGFSQIAALLLATSPAWALAVALFKRSSPGDQTAGTPVESMESWVMLSSNNAPTIPSLHLEGRPFTISEYGEEDGAMPQPSDGGPRRRHSRYHNTSDDTVVTVGTLGRTLCDTDPQSSASSSR